MKVEIFTSSLSGSNEEAGRFSAQAPVAGAVVDARRRSPQTTVAASTAITYSVPTPLCSVAGTAGMEVLLTPLDERRPPMEPSETAASMGGHLKSELPPSALDRRCCNKFRLTELSCY